MPQHIGERIKLYRKQRRIGQDVVAAACGITRQAVSRWERGLQDPDEAKLPAIAAALGVDVLDLTGVVMYPSEIGSLELPAEFAEFGNYTTARCASLMTLRKADGIWQGIADELNAAPLVKKQQFKGTPYAILVDCPSQLSTVPVRSTLLVDVGADITTGDVALVAVEGIVQCARVYPSLAGTLIENSNGRQLFGSGDSRFEVIGPVIELRIAAQDI